jgi:TRAP-type C4-dicarboxylate transport system permease small subunit
MKAIKWLEGNFEFVLVVSLLAIMTTAVFLQVVTRTFNYSLSWTEELARYCFIWLVYIGISYAVKEKKHIKIEALEMVMDEDGRKLLGLISHVIFLLFSIFVVFVGSNMVINLYFLGQTSPALGLPMWIVYLAGPVGFSLCAVRLVQQLKDKLDDYFQESDK